MITYEYLLFLYVKDEIDPWHKDNLRNDLIFKIVTIVVLGPILLVGILTTMAATRINNKLEQYVAVVKRKRLNRIHYKRIRIKSNNTLQGKLTLTKELVYTIIVMRNSKICCVLNNSGTLIELNMNDIEIL
jgi:hypothetical protein